MYNTEFKNEQINITMPKAGIFHIKVSKKGEFKDTLLTKYNILKELGDLDGVISTKDESTKIECGKYFAQTKKDRSVIEFGGSKRDISLLIDLRDKGFAIDIPIEKDERLFGLGDETRQSVMKRGRTATMWQKNLYTYGPIPFMLSDKGWGILVNCTYKHTYDLGDTDADKIKIEATNGTVDFYIFLADSMKEIIGLYTDISGKPVLLPKEAYGVAFVCNEEEGARDLLHNCYMFRQEGIPCDIMGLEPSWMDKHYDYSIKKKWNPEKFYLPYWQPENYSGRSSFFFNLRQMGYLLSLWLCGDYDLIWHEEGNANDGETEEELRDYDGEAVLDDHFDGGAVVMDKITVPKEPWFNHLKKFVDQGVGCFKLDAAMQVMEHPDRLWGGKYTDDEIHNLYPVVYVKQMKEGFEEYTGRRAMVYSPSLYAGTQQYAATWAGDTGGIENVIAYINNMAFCGHANASCDMESGTMAGVHFGFLMPWSQLMSWRWWSHPWLMGEELHEGTRYYANLRSALFPYIYSMAHNAAKTGLAISRPLSLMYENESRFDCRRNMYMFGESMLVGVYNMHLDLPEGRWLDWWTGDIYEGNQEIDYEIPEGRGGALFIKEGSVFVMQKPRPYLKKVLKDEEYTINIFPGKDCSFDFVEDDGETYAYKDGAYGNTHISVSDSTKDGFTLTVYRRTVPGGQEIELPEITDFKVKVLGDKKPTSVSVEGKNVDISYDEAEKATLFNIPKESRKDNDVVCVVKF